MDGDIIYSNSVRVRTGDMSYMTLNGVHMDTRVLSPSVRMTSGDDLSDTAYYIHAGGVPDETPVYDTSGIYNTTDEMKDSVIKDLEMASGNAFTYMPALDREAINGRIKEYNSYTKDSLAIELPESAGRYYPKSYTDTLKTHICAPSGAYDL